MSFKEYVIQNPGWTEDELPLPIVRYKTFLAYSDVEMLLTEKLLAASSDIASSDSLYACVIMKKGTLSIFYGSARYHEDLEEAILVKENITGDSSILAHLNIILRNDKPRIGGDLHLAYMQSFSVAEKKQIIECLIGNIDRRLFAGEFLEVKVDNIFFAGYNGDTNKLDYVSNV